MILRDPAKGTNQVSSGMGTPNLGNHLEVWALHWALAVYLHTWNPCPTMRRFDAVKENTSWYDIRVAGHGEFKQPSSTVQDKSDVLW